MLGEFDKASRPGASWMNADGALIVAPFLFWVLNTYSLIVAPFLFWVLNTYYVEDISCLAGRVLELRGA